MRNIKNVLLFKQVEFRTRRSIYSSVVQWIENNAKFFWLTEYQHYDKILALYQLFDKIVAPFQLIDISNLRKNSSFPLGIKN